MDQFMNENNSDNMDVLNDVLAVLDADVDFNGHNDHHHHQQQQQQQQEQQQKLQQIQHYLQQQQPQQQQMLPYTFIVEQPASKAIRFRYKCEGRSAGSIPGVNSTPENKTYPTIRVIGYVGRAVVVVSLVTKDSYSGKYRAHPHNLVGKGCIEERGVCHVKISPNNNMEVSFSNLGIQCVKKKEIGTSFKTRKEIRVDPFKAGFSHKNQPIELNVVRLCFEVYLPNEKDEFKIRLEPIVSDPIYDKKAMSDLVICRLSHCCASAAGGTSVILLCEKVLKDDIQVRFFQKINDEVIWEKNAEFTTNDVHKQVAITFKTPKYDLNPDDKAVKVFVQLRRPSDGAVGEPRPFEMIPIGAGRPLFWSLQKTINENSYIPKKAIPIDSSIIPNNNDVITDKHNNKNNNINNNENSNNIDMSGSKISALRAFYNLHTKNNDNIDKKNGFIPKNISINNTLDNSDKSHGQESNIEPVIINNDNNKFQEINNEKKWFDYSEIGKWIEKNNQQLIDNNNGDDEQNNNDKLNEIAEIDKIYEDTHKKIIKTKLINNNKSMEIDVLDNQTYTSLQLAMKNPIELYDDDKRYEDVMIEKTLSSSSLSPPPPPPPPLLAKRSEMNINDEKLPPLPPKRSKKMSSMPVLPRTSSFTTVNAPNKNLPLLPGTLLKPKQGLLSKLFSKKVKKLSNDKITNDKINTTSSSLRNSLQDFTDNSSTNNKLNRTSLNGGALPSRSCDLKGDESPPYGFDLTEAEHYALYTAMAPHATTSEFDEMSFYYSPVEGGKILTDGKQN
ncbi:embryonic polarity protein dorsal-like isoform X1 [Aphidius gifuensis]|uniref:embryonic polarity protein dorsal-like isoform X1 n=1 Tax=Aphidius gifuensis TaxID=684658 RepID=UPI001CDBFA6C|nr:embryonic polarity protein dorsal-like isoform X1 [Aphidius gifuensis]XP_044002100.1 embryonic polarity protein dorsal-like isoform X1 [Aphidius gifuensis]XP_044002101.1 embryonic polarity protein dorsal-like isoform X1 [Aphidius gifuensis]